MTKLPDGSRNLTCYSCGYSLADLPTHAVCPECSVPVDVSMDARLHFDRSIPKPRLLTGLLMAIAFIEVGVPIATVASLITVNSPWNSWQQLMPFLMIAGGGIGIEAAWCAIAATNSVLKAQRAARTVGVTSAISVLCIFLGFISLAGGLFPATLFAFAIFCISAAIGATAKVIFMESIANLFPRRKRQQLLRLNRISFVLFYVSVGCAFLGMLLPPLFLAIPLGIAAAAWRSFEFSRRIRAAAPVS